MNPKRYALLIVLIGSLALAGRAEAHANLVTSVPAAGATVEQAPKELVLTFTERLDPSYTRVQIVNSAHEIVNAGPGTISADNPYELRLVLGDMPRDSYTALWRALSADDGHPSEGQVPFGVGVAVPDDALIPPPGAPDPALETPPFVSLARWLSLLALALACGSLPFALLAWQPALASTQNGTTPQAEWQVADALQTQRMRQLTLVGCAALIVATLLSMPLQAAQIAQVAPLAAFGEPLARFVASRPGILLAVRVLLALLALLVARRLAPWAMAPGRWLALVALAAALLLTWSLGSHAAALGSAAPLAIALDWLHLAAMVAWLGGLVPLAFAVSQAIRQPQQALPLRALIPRFSRLAIASVVVLALTGLYSYTQHIGDLALLPATTYGRALLAKTGLFVVLLALGGLNLLVLSPRMWHGAAQLAGQLRRAVRVELLLGALLLLLVGAMTSVAPSRTAWEAHQAQGLAEQAQVGDVSMTLRVAPALIGSNQFAVDLHDPRPGADAVPAEVLLRFGMQGMQAEPVETPMNTTDMQRYTASGAFMTMGGRWEVEVVVRRAGFDDVRHTFELDILQSAAHEHHE